MIPNKKLIVTGLCFTSLAISQHLLAGHSNAAIDALAWGFSIILCGVVLGRLIPGAAHFSLLIIVQLWLGFMVGLTEVGTVIFWLASAWSLGMLLRRLGNTEGHLENSFTESLFFGMAVWLAIWGGMLHFAVNTRALYLVLCLLPFWVLAGQVSVLRNDFCTRIDAMQDWMRSIPLWAWVAGLAVIGWVLRWASLPSVSYDDHAVHLRIWTELLTRQRYSFDIHTQIWSAAPFAVDLLHAGLSLMAASDARGAMNLALAILLLGLMSRIFQIWKLPAWTQWLLIVLMASTPMLGNLLLTLQAELMLAVLALAGLRLVLEAEGGWRGKHVLGVLACAALCAATKLPGVVLGVTLLVALMLRWREQRATPGFLQYRRRCSVFLSLVPLGFVAMHSYVLAFKITGNPVFPLYNAIFLSPYFPSVNFSDTHWNHGLSLWRYVRVFFHTSEFFETANYTAGWQYLLMLPIAMLALLRSGVPSGLRIILVPLLGFGSIMFAAIQYWRYIFPVMPFACIVCASFFMGDNRACRKIALILALVCIAANLFRFQKTSWLMKSPAVMAYTYEGRRNVIRRYAPVALLTEKVNQLYPGARVLYPSDTPYGATLHGTPLYVNWYSPFRETRFNSLRDFKGLADFISKEKVDFFILSPGTSNASHVLLREYMAQNGYVLGQEGSFLLYSSSTTPVLYRNIFDLHASIKKQTGSVDLLLPVTDAGIATSAESKVLAVFPTLGAQQARYGVEFSCLSEDGYFVAQINWDKGEPYYRLVSCAARSVSFIEAIPIPFGATQGTIYVTSREASSVQVKKLTVEAH